MLSNKINQKLRLSLPAILVILLLGALSAQLSLAADSLLYVINTSGETLSRINLATNAVDNDILTLGSDVFCFPNQIVVQDSLAFVVNSGTDEIQIINLPSLGTANFINTGVGTNPFWMAFYDTQYVYVTNLLTNEVVKVNAINGSIVDNIPVGVSPEGILINDFKAYVAITAFDFGTFTYGQGKVAVIDTEADTVLYTVDVGKNPQFLAVDRGGRIHVVCTGDYSSTFGIVYVIDPVVDSVVDSIAIGGSPGQISIGPDNIAYIAAGGWVTNGFVYTYDAGGGQVLHNSDNPLFVDSGCVMVVTFQDSTCFTGAFKDFVRQIDSGGLALNVYGLGDGPSHAAFNYKPGDVNGDFSMNILDLTYLVDFIFRGGPDIPFPKWRSNLNADFLNADILDLTYTVDFLFRGGQPARMPPTWVE